MDELLHRLRAAAEPTRLRILALCARGELTVSDLTNILGQSQPRVSRHLKLLVEAGLLQRFREGTWAFYRFTATDGAAHLARTLVDLIPKDDDVFSRDLDRLEAVKRTRAAEAAEFFRRNAAQWDEIRSLYINDEAVEAALLDILPKSELGTLLDIGTGTGRILEMFGDTIEHGVGIDLSREMLAVARVSLERQGLKNCYVRYGDMNQLPLGQEAFDAITFHLVLHYAESPAQAIREAARFLNPGGRLVVIDFAPHQVKSLRTEHAHRWLGFDDGEIGDWFRASGLHAEDVVRLPGNPLTVCLWPAVRRKNAGAELPKSREAAELRA